MIEQNFDLQQDQTLKICGCSKDVPWMIYHEFSDICLGRCALCAKKIDLSYDKRKKCWCAVFSHSAGVTYQYSAFCEYLVKKIGKDKYKEFCDEYMKECLNRGVMRWIDEQ